jgi:uncharacterized RDD family membrane protein YckC
MQYAGFWRRFAAVLIDGLFLSLPCLALSIIFPFGVVFASLIYKPVFEASPLKATPGKALMGIVVVSESGQRLSLRQAFIRYLASFFSSLLLMCGYLMSLFTEKRQTLHDIIAETVVIHEKSPEVNYFSVWLGEFKKLWGKLDLSPSQTNNLETLEQLHKLFQTGAITEQEYLSKKEEILSKV